MKRLFTPLALLVVILSGCTINIDSESGSRDSSPRVFNAVIEGGLTKTVVEGGGFVWSEGDAISIFEGSGANTQWLLSSGAGTREATFTEVLGSQTSSITLSRNYAIYPYDGNTSINASGEISFTLPHTQVYVPSSFSAGDFPIVAATQNTQDNTLQFKNICGAFVFSLKDGQNSSVITSITLKGNNGEKLSGGATVVASPDAAPVITMAADASDEVRLSYTSGVALGTEPVDFWIVVPPTEFTSGLTVTMEDITGATMTRRINASVAIGRGDVQPVSAINYTPDQTQYCTFPDAKFRAYVLNNFDRDGDGKISRSEANLVTEVEVSTLDISSLDGIENFVNLKRLVCTGRDGSTGLLKELDLRALPGLEYLDCSSNRSLKSLSFPSGSQLKTLVCANDSLTSLNLGNCTALEYLDCSTSSVKTLAVNKCTNLKYLDCSHNALSTLNASACLLLEELHAASNSFSSLAIARNTALKVVNASYNAIANISLTSLTELRSLDLQGNNLKKIELEANVLLEDLNVSLNPFTSPLNLSANVNLKTLNCSSCLLSSLDVAALGNLTLLDCSSNSITSLDLGSNAKLHTLLCNSNGMTSLNLAGAASLEHLQCSKNALTQLNLSGCTSLKRLYCQTNNLSSLDLRSIAVDILFCYGNPSLATLYLKKGTTLTALVYDTAITTVTYI